MAKLLFMMYDPFLVISIAIGAGVIIGYFLARWQRRGRVVEPSNPEVERIINQNQAQIMELFEEHPQITNDDVQQLLDVSDATATRYLSQLEDEGLIKQKDGSRGVHYIKTA